MVSLRIQREIVKEIPKEIRITKFKYLLFFGESLNVKNRFAFNI